MSKVINKKAIIGALIKNSKNTKSSRSLFAKLRFFIWINFIVKKATHKRCLRQANRILKILNQDEFKKYPGKLFAYLREIDPFAFEELLLLSFKSRGFKVKHNLAYTGDGGADGQVIFPDGSRWLIQAKRYENHINPQHVKSLSNLVCRLRADGGIFIHTGKTGESAYQHLGDNVVLLSGGNLHAFIAYALGVH